MDIQHVEIRDLATIDRKHTNNLIASVKRLEKKSFPGSEALDFDTELKKRNTHLVCAIENASVIGEGISLIAYLVYARMKRTVLLHKLCVLQEHRGNGIGRQMMTWLMVELTKKGCESIQLWVDESRKPARALYASLGFEEVDYVVDYYAPGRAGFKMILHLHSG